MEVMCLPKMSSHVTTGIKKRPGGNGFSAGAIPWAGVGAAVGGWLDVVAGLLPGLLLMETGDGPPRDHPDCDEEWKVARDYCEQLLSMPNPPRGQTGGYTNINDCARGFVSEECGGNPIDWGHHKRIGELEDAPLPSGKQTSANSCLSGTEGPVHQDINPQDLGSHLGTNFYFELSRTERQGSCGM